MRLYPGHTSNHLCFALQEQKALFTGDHVMGWSTSIISPPDGDMADYMQSLELLLERDDEIYWPTHGPSIIDPKTHVQAYIDHRLEREQQILACIDQGTHQIRDMVPLMYRDTPIHVPSSGPQHSSAMENLVRKGQVVVQGEGLTLESSYVRA